MTSKIVSKIAGNLMNPDRIFKQDDKQKDFLLGTLLGIATGIAEKHDKIKDEIHQGFSGNFEWVDSDPEAQGYKSGVLYLPAGVNEMLIDAVKAADGGQVKFAFEVYSERAENARKRSWSFRNLAETETVDPMAEMRRYLPGANKPAQIEPPKDGDGDKAPAKEPAKVGGKL